MEKKIKEQQSETVMKQQTTSRISTYNFGLYLHTWCARSLHCAPSEEIDTSSLFHWTKPKEDGLMNVYAPRYDPCLSHFTDKDG